MQPPPVRDEACYIRSDCHILQCNVRLCKATPTPACLTLELTSIAVVPRAQQGNQVLLTTWEQI